DEWSYWFPNIVTKEELIRVLSPGSSNKNPYGTLHMVYKEMQVTSAMVPNKKFTVLRTCLQIDQGTWVIAEPSHVDAPNTYRRLPSGCLIERITKKLSKEKMQQSIESITFAINHTVERVKEALEKHQDLLREECAYATCIEIGQLRSSSCKTSYECLN
nr:homeobox-leucine zipper protein ROC8 [Tanacetum cinerariifolium]